MATIVVTMNEAELEDAIRTWLEKRGMKPSRPNAVTVKQDPKDFRGEQGGIQVMIEAEPINR